MKVRAISPTVVHYASKKHWYEGMPFLGNLKWRIQSIDSWIRALLRRHNHIHMDALRRGQWYDSDIRIFEANFQFLVNYVEKELAWMQLITEGKARWYHRWFGVHNGRDLGLKYLHWEIQLGDDSLGQSDAAKKVKELYLWYRDIRPNRTDPFDSVPDRDWETEPAEDGFNRLVISEDSEYIKALQQAHELDQKYYDEDTQKAIEIVKLRQFLWT